MIGSLYTKIRQKTFFNAGDSLKMCIFNAPTPEKYSRPFLKIFIFRPRPTFFQNHPKPIRKRPLTTPRHIPRHPKIDEKVTPNRPPGSRESNRRPPDPLSDAQTTRLFRPHISPPLRVSYVSEIQNLYVKNTECARAGFSVAKIERARVFL